MVALCNKCSTYNSNRMNCAFCGSFDLTVIEMTPSQESSFYEKQQAELEQQYQKFLKEYKDRWR